MIHHDQVIHTFKLNRACPLMIEYSMFSAITGLIVEILSMLFSVMLCNGLKMNEYEAYWVT